MKELQAQFEKETAQPSQVVNTEGTFYTQEYVHWLETRAKMLWDYSIRLENKLKQQA